MPDRELFHFFSDVSSTLLYALDLGLQVRLDEPQPEPRQRLLDREEISGIEGGVFMLFRPDWKYGPLQFMRIAGGHNSGKFCVSPRVNCSPISIYFVGERLFRAWPRFRGCAGALKPSAVRLLA